MTGAGWNLNLANRTVGGYRSHSAWMGASSRTQNVGTEKGEAVSNKAGTRAVAAGTGNVAAGAGIIPGGAAAVYAGAQSRGGTNLALDASVSGTAAVSETEAVECQTCKERKYVDGSNDASVSFQTPGHISPEAAPAMVMAHEQEHVSNNRAEAEAEGREVVSQSVSIHTSICPECGRVYVSGGTTRTTTQNKTDSDAFTTEYMKVMSGAQGTRFDTRV